MENWHSKTAKAVQDELYCGPKGLSNANAEERLVKYGPNELEEKEKKSIFKLILAQFNNFIIWVLMAAVVLSLYTDEMFEAVLITVILILNAVVGFWQEYKAEKSIEALKKLAALQAKVIRGGHELRIDARKLVPGDLILLETGDKVPADARLIEAVRLETGESALTGESTPVKKDIQPVKDTAPLAERTSMVYSTTTVSSGRGRAVVVSTGMNTEIGKIAHLVQEVKSKETPLQQKLGHLGKVLGIGTLIICAVVLVTVLLKGTEADEAFKLAISLAVAAIPEGLAAVVTICLALGVQRMVKKHALVRILPAVETLGSCNVICTDKTGTLTYNQMTVREIYANDQLIEVTGQGYIPEGQFEQDSKKIDTKNIELLLRIGTLNNDSKLEKKETWEIFGDPTEAALVVAARKAGLVQEELAKEMPRTDELPFDSARKLMTTVHGKVAYVKGAPDVIIDLCDRIHVNGKVRKLTKKDRQNILDRNLGMANKALRVLGFAYKDIKGPKIEQNLVFVGLMGMIDPPRKEVMDSIRRCKEAGIKVVMITGDHKATAVAIGRELGLEEGKVLTGPELDQKSSLQDVVEHVSIYARVSPQHKLSIISALKSKDYVVAMTGDGVNDAPALKRADIGIAMGITGTDVSKEASDMILTDDNFSSIVNAVEEGRGIYDNIRKFVKYLLSSNLGEVLTVFVAVLIGVTGTGGDVLIPLTAIQLLWINILTDAFPALALGVDPTDKDAMRRPPRKMSDRIISREYAYDMVFVGVIMAIGTLFVFYNGLRTSEIYAITMAFTTLVVFQLFNVFNCKSDQKSIFKTGILNNKWLLYGVLLSMALQLLVVYAPAIFAGIDNALDLPLFMEGYDLGEKLGTTSLEFADWLVVIGVGSTVLWFTEIKKIIRSLIHDRA